MRARPVRALSLLFLRPATLQAAARQPCAIAIVGATVIDGNGGEPIADGTVLIRNGKCEQVGKRADVRVHDCAQKVASCKSQVASRESQETDVAIQFRAQRRSSLQFPRQASERRAGAPCR